MRSFPLYYQQLIQSLSRFDGLPPLFLRFFLVPVFWMAGSNKIDFTTMMPYESTVEWFGNSRWGLGLPMPALMAFLAGWSEVLGAVLLTLGLATRFITIPLMVTMLVAIFTVHIDNGWQAIADPLAPFANDRVMESAERLNRAKSILKEYGHYSWLTSKGSIVILNNGVEFAVTYLIMLFSLFFTGGGRYFSVDFYLKNILLPVIPNNKRD